MEFKVGDRVRIFGCNDDFTSCLDGKLGTIVRVNERDCQVEVDGVENFLGGWWIWNDNLTLLGG